MPTTLRIATFLAPNIRPVYQAVAAHLGRALGLPVELVDGASFDQFAAGQADAGFICGLPYVRLTRQSPPPVTLLAAPVLLGERYGGRPIYYSDVIARRPSPYRTFADLRGRSWAYNDPASHSGYNLTRYHLVHIGATCGFFGRVVEAGFHQRSIRLVASGAVDASAIDSQVLAVELRDHPDLAEQIEIIDTLGPSTIQPVVAAARLPPALRADLTAALLSASGDPAVRPALARGLVDRFVPIADSAYDDIRAMLAAAEDIGFLTLK